MFYEKLGIGPGDLVALIGGGGKTNLMTKLTSELTNHKKKVLISTTTKIFAPEIPERKKLVLTNDGNFIKNIKDVISHYQYAILGKEIDNRKLIGPEENIICKIKKEIQIDCIIVETDGSRGRSIKAHKDYEPVIPECSNIVIAIIGIDVIGRPINDINIHRSEIFCNLWNTKPESILTEEIASLALSNNRGYRKFIPNSSKYIVLINKVDSEERKSSAVKLSELLFEHGIRNIFFGDINLNEIIEFTK
jgi:probable selenium-dependent hydroxylase accessory protein YqeC